MTSFCTQVYFVMADWSVVEVVRRCLEGDAKAAEQPVRPRPADDDDILYIGDD